MASQIYSNARASYQENFLLGKERISRLIEADSLLEAYKVLAEVNFGGGAYDGLETDFEAIIRLDEEKFFAFIREACPSQNLKEYLFVPNDYHNAEAFMRAKHLKLDAEEMLVIDGLMDNESLKDKIFSDKYKDFNPTMQQALIGAEEKLVSGCRSGAEVSLIFKKALYQNLYEITKKDRVLTEIYSSRADGANVSLALRSRDFKWCKENVVPGGKLTLQEIKILCEEPIESLKEKSKNIKAQIDVKSAIDAFINGKPLSDFEREQEGFAVRYLRTKKYSQQGIVPFMNYCFLKKTEHINVRIILSGILNRHDKADIKRSLRDSYER